MSTDVSLTLRRFLTSRVALVASIVVCAVLFFQLVQVVTRSASTGRDIASLTSQVESLKAEQKRLEQLRSFLQTDFFAEQEARTKFGLQKEGEHALIISRPDDSSRSGSNDTQPSKSDTSTQSSEGALRSRSVVQAILEQKNYHQWWQFFFGWP